MTNKRVIRNCFCGDVAHPLVLSREDEVVRAGYQSLGSQITTLLAAGERLQASREAQYDWPDGEFDDIDSVVPDPIRDPAFDLADASTYLNASRSRLAALRTKYARKVPASAPVTEPKPVDVPTPDKV